MRLAGTGEAVLGECDHPADHDAFKQGCVVILEVAIPGKGHEDVREGQQDDRRHSTYSAKSLVLVLLRPTPPSG
jgi:hypothetical protein